MVGLIFDMDGVLVDTEEAHFTSWQNALKSVQIDIDLNFYHHYIQARKRELVLKFILPNATEQHYENIIQIKNDYFLEYLAKNQVHLVFQDALTFLESIKNKGVDAKLIVASASRNAPLVLEMTGLNRFFQEVITSNDVKVGKPDPEMFLLAAHRLGLKPCECIVFEDSKSGIAAGKSGGFYTIAIDRTNQLKETIANLKVRSFNLLDSHQLNSMITQGDNI